MGFWSSFAKIAGNIGGSFIGDPMLGSQVVGTIQGLTGWDTGQKGSGATNTTGGSGPGGLLGVNAGEVATPPVNPAVQQGLDTLQGPKSYLSGVMNGSQEQTQGLLSPEVSTVLSQYDNAAKTAAELGPRGGGRTAILAEAPFKKAAAYGQALRGAKQQAISELPKIGEAEANIGNTQQQLAQQYKLGQVGVNAAQNSSILRSQENRAKQYSDIGSGIGGILTRIITNSKMGGGGGFSMGGGGGYSTTSAGPGSGFDIPLGSLGTPEG